MTLVENVRLVINRRALKRACARAALRAVTRGGPYDVRGSALVIWPLEAGADARPIGMVTWEWGQPAEPFATVTRVEAADGHEPEAILGHLRRLLNPAGAVGPGDEYG